MSCMGIIGNKGIQISWIRGVYRVFHRFVSSSMSSATLALAGRIRRGIVLSKKLELESICRPRFVCPFHPPPSRQVHVSEHRMPTSS
jgi:hypothetical protein